MMSKITITAETRERLPDTFYLELGTLLNKYNFSSSPRVVDTGRVKYVFGIEVDNA